MGRLGYCARVDIADSRPRVAWLVGGHPYDAASLGRLLDSLDAEVSLITWPTAGEMFTPSGVIRLLQDFDVLALYDMPGIRFRPGESPEFVAPSDDIVAAWSALTNRGMPVLGLHHSIASWPTWPGFAEILKGRFHYAPARLRGVSYPDSGYAMNVKQRFDVAMPDHPVCVGLPTSFELTDETYQCPVFDAEVAVLIRTNAPRDDAHHTSAFAAVRRKSDPRWRHSPASDAVAWTHSYGASQVVYLQPGEGPESFDNHWYRMLVNNAVKWLAELQRRGQ